MSNPSLPAYLQSLSLPNRAETAVANLGTGTPPYISLKANRFTLVDAAGAEEPVETMDGKIGFYLDCIIADLNDHMSKVYYDKAYDPNAQQYEPPACFSDNGVGPSRAAAKPQARTCAECPQGAWGSKTSAVSGKGVKACADQYKLAAMIPGDDVIFLLRVPPNSLGNLRTYLNKCQAMKTNVATVVTRIWFVSQGTINFTGVSYIQEPEAKRLVALLQSKATDQLVGRTDQPRAEALPPAQPLAQIAPPQEQALFVPAAAPSAAVPASQPSPLPPAIPLQQGIPMQSPAGGAPSASPSDPAPRQRRKRNTAAVNEAPQQAQGAPVAPFRPEAAPAPQNASANFGIQQPGQVDAGLESTLDSLFGAAGQ